MNPIVVLVRAHIRGQGDDDMTTALKLRDQAIAV